MKVASSTFAALAYLASVSHSTMAETLAIHRLPAALALEAVAEAVSVCAKQGHRVTSTVINPDGVRIALLHDENCAILQPEPHDLIDLPSRAGADTGNIHIVDQKEDRRYSSFGDSAKGRAKEAGPNSVVSFFVSSRSYHPLCGMRWDNNCNPPFSLPGSSG